ncbi:zinc finger protein 771-like isoform X1 [Syngnathoides biaculeatus]|uniref:zinc finger protein 771-like isoform X1 n=1 Tax=Syngnathoides biaculeatus TaxID=300417 RepID=UPI002ADDB9FF|nr:zinc finger protein 771-like isoform X1 [Syngnathoides biaculeatus]
MAFLIASKWSWCENVCKKHSRLRGRTLGPKRGKEATTSTTGHSLRFAPSKSAAQGRTAVSLWPVVFSIFQRGVCLPRKTLSPTVVFRRYTGVYVVEILPRGTGVARPVSRESEELGLRLVDTAVTSLDLYSQISENLKVWEQSVSCHIKEEEEDEEVQHIKEEEFLHLKEEEQEEIIHGPSTGIHLKTEDGQGEERRGAEAPRRNNSSDGECNSRRLQTDSHVDSYEELEGDMTCRTSKKCWKCSQCRKAFASMSSLKRHVKIHTGEKPFSCSDCGQRFTQKRYLKIHTRTHTGEKPFSCSICGQRFTQKGYLKIHRRIHTGEKPFSCSVCGQSFTQKGYLKIHTRTHTGEKPFSCLVCGQRFSLKGTLKRHTRTHTGEKPVSCSICGQRFTQNRCLKIHTRTHTGEKPFSCSICSRTFSIKSSLQRHMRTHTGEKPFSCSVCVQRFSYEYRAQTHKCGGENSSDLGGSNSYVKI